MQRTLWLSPGFLAFFESSVAAAAIGTINAPTIAPIPIPTPFLVPNLAPTTDPPSNSCIYRDGYRSLYSIIQTCLLTIFACIWVAVHRNIPGPNQSRIYIQLEWLKVVALTLLVPEWILAWAVRQWFSARKLAEALEARRISAQRDWEENQKITSMTIVADVRSVSGGEEGADSVIGNSERSRKDEERLMQCYRTLRAGAVDKELFLDVGKRQKYLGRTDQCETNFYKPNTSYSQLIAAWTKTHAFFVVMGGFHFYNDGNPVYPLSPRQVADLVERRALMPPMLHELKDRSKGDAVSKGIAIVQTLWFVMQFVAREIEHLPITGLEVMTLAYTVITFAMYAAWWHKPLNVSYPVPVPVGSARKERVFPYAMSERIMKYVMGDQDFLVELSEEERIPTFWSGRGRSGVIVADVVALLVAMVFGTVHCIAWHYAFPSHFEQLIWRASSISITAIPVSMALLTFLLGDLLRTGWSSDFTPMESVGVVSLAICAILYIIGRLILVILSFTTLRSLSAGAYLTVHWTTFIPHV